MMPTIHTTIVSQDKLLLVYAIVKGLATNVEKIIEQEIRECATKKQKFVALLFLSLITGVCEALRVKFITNDERIKNERALTARTIEKIVGESTATATLVHPTATKLGQATWIGKMLQELNKSLNVCVQV